MKDVKKKYYLIRRIRMSQSCHERKIKFRYNIRKCDIQKEKFCIGKYKFNNKKGMKYAVVGHSGAGKSTLFKLIMGYEKTVPALSD